MTTGDRDDYHELEAASLRHWTSFREACTADGIDDLTFLASLAAHVTEVLREHPDLAAEWLAGISTQLREEQALSEQEPS